MTTTIDLFSGAGGFTEGATQAGARVIFCANHWPEAVAVHAANHPQTTHACQDLHQIDWNVVPKHDLMIASPACQPHSQARRADLPHHDKLRSTAWAVVACAEAHRPTMFAVENVAWFTKWELYDIWLSALRRLGYHVTTQVLNAHDFGVPQDRRRLFVVGHRKKEIYIVKPGIPRVTARSVVQWDAPGRWTTIDRPGRSPLVLRQYRNGRPIHGEAFMVGYHSDKHYGVTLDGPIGCQTTKDQWGLILGDRIRMFNLEELRALMGFRLDYQLPRLRKEAIAMLGNAVPPPLARGVVSQMLAQA